MRATALVGLAALASAPASATVYQFDWTGQVSSVNGNTSATGVKVNDAATASFRFDDQSMVAMPSVFAPQMNPYTGILTNYAFSVGSIALTAPTLTTGLFTENNWYGWSGFSFDPHFDSPAYDLEHSAMGLSGGYLGTPLANGFALGGLTSQQLILHVGSGAARENIVATVRATVTVLSAVPEPATWGMMICGFGLVGGVLRHRRKAVPRLA